MELQRYQDLLASVRHDDNFHSIKALVQPDWPEVKEIAEVLLNTPDFVLACQEFVHSFTTYKREIGDFWTTPEEMLGRRAGDCITGDTPVWIRKNGRPTIVETRELLPIGDYTQYFGLDILTPNGFAPLISVRRKRIQPTLRILTTSDVGMTDEHKLVVNIHLTGQARYCVAKEINPSQITRIYPDLDSLSFLHGVVSDYEAGWAHGLFFADGSSSLRDIETLGGESWRIVNANSNYLERASSTLSILYPGIKFPIKLFDSYRRGKDVKSAKFVGQRKKNLYCMDALLEVDSQKGIRGQFVREYRERFYNTYGIKRVPDFVLQGSQEMAKGFWDGVHAGDGEQEGLRITSHHKLSTFGLSMILHKLGSNPSVAPDHSAIRIRDSLKLAKNWRFNGVVEEVFDLATETGEFVAADIAVKNCDDKAILLVSLLRNKLSAKQVYCAFGYWGKGSSREGHMWVVMEGAGGADRIIESTAVPGAPQKGQYFLEAMFNDKFAFSYPAGIKNFNLLPIAVED